MSNLVPSGLGSELMPARQTRATGRQLARMESRTELRIRGVENESDVQAAKIDAVGYVAKRALYVVGAVTQSEQQLAQMVPLAASRLQAIGDMAAFAATEIVADVANRVRRS